MILLFYYQNTYKVYKFMYEIEIWNNGKNKIPIIVSIPHSGTYIPQTMKEKLVDNLIFANMDWYLPNLYSFLKDLEITTIVNNVSRYVIDPNRKITDSINTSYLDNYVYTKTTFNNPMYNTDLEDEEIRDRITKYYAPYHQTLENLINDKLSYFNKIYLIDLHSFGKDIDANIVLGNINGQTLSKELTMSIKNTLEKLDFIVSLNNPYSGGYITKKYANNKVETLQLELSYKKYIDNRTFRNEEFPRINKTLFTETQEKLKYFFEKMIHTIEENF